MTDDEKSQKVRARFFLGVAQARWPWRDENTMPLFPLLMVMDEAMMDADAKFEAAKTRHSGFNTHNHERK